ncbi:putative ABC transport system permease protein [Metabacillus crassostreae]|uniref:FtsX-like permease family protein n=1 Tax=Metabacillus crassostreae TaxID=929098 RepID=UPI0019574416|nr:FtsX-like permease family protein [Metabacillus crassostreae]MBM7602496.1 putative ABC transport system permease protein [Metabacillus crassostreae]
MNNKLYFKLAATNIKNNRLMFLPYIVTCIVIVALFYTINNLVNAEALKSISGGNFTIDVMKFGSILFTVLSLLFLIYTNSFIFKRRKKEIGLYNLLGLEKKHIKKILLIENWMLAFITIFIGILMGTMFNQIVGKAMSSLMNVSLTVNAISLSAMIKTIATYMIFFFIIHLSNIKQIHSIRVIELMKGAQVGEVEPKAKFVWALLGGISLITGYILSFKVNNPKDDFNVMFMAIIFVIVASYLLFIAISIVVLKILRKNDGFYYNKKYFTLISTLLYRMKLNAVGLANIAVLSTATLIVMTTTVSLYFGVDKELNNAFQYDVSIQNTVENQANQKELQDFIDSNKERFGIEIKSATSYRGGKYAADLTGDEKEEFFLLLPLEDFNKLTKRNLSLAANEVLLLEDEVTAKLKSITVEDTSFDVKDTVKDLPIDSSLADSVDANWMFVIAPLTGDLAHKVGLENPIVFTMFQDFNIQGSTNAVNEFSHEIAKKAESIGNVDVSSKSIYRETLLVRYGSLLFLGMLISTILFAETALMIFYKQITEGYDDRKRFSIMKKVGMSEKEISQTIRKQTLIMFFAPLAVALIHLTVGLQLVTNIIGIAIEDMGLIVLGSAVCAAIIYTIIYGVTFIFTEKSYKKIVEQ